MRRIAPMRNLAVSSTLAMAAALVHAPQARAQSYLATGTVVAGSATVDQSVAGATTVTVNTPSTVINWTPDDTSASGGAIFFQAAGTTATFTNNQASTSDFAVLNNILPSGAATGRAIAFFGDTRTLLQSASGTTTGGTVYFYTPGGIIVGNTGSFNVGNIALTTSPVAFDATGNFGATGAVTGNQTVGFGAAQAGSFVQLSGGAQINAVSAQSSYVAVVAPAVINNAAISVSGSAALVAADAATITFSPDGLYDITIDSGTSATNTTLQQSGSIGGPAGSSNSSGTFAHNIYLVTAPKNSMVFMLVSSGASLGFDAAVSAQTVGDKVVLSGGYNIANGAIQDQGAPVGTGGAVVNVFNSNFTSSTDISASQQAVLSVDGTQGGDTSANVTGDLRLHGGRFANINVTNGGGLGISGNTEILTIDPGLTAAVGSDTTGGNVNVSVNGTGSVLALNGSSTILRADATGGNATVAGNAVGRGTGGNATISAGQGGRIDVAGTLEVSADGFGGRTLDTNAIGFGAGGAGRGGIAQVFVNDGAASISGAQAIVHADGIGQLGNCLTACTIESGTGMGGNVFVGALTDNANSTINFGGITLSSGGFGGAGNTLAGSAGTGGFATIQVNSGNTLNASSISIDAQGQGGEQLGSNLVAGAGTGGTINLTLRDNATLNLGNLLSLSATGSGGNANLSVGGSDSSGGKGTGGNAFVSINGGTLAGASAFVSVATDGFGGTAANVLATTPTAKGGDGQGGNAQFVVTVGANAVAGQATANNLRVRSSAQAGSSVGGLLGVATGASAIVAVQSGATATLGGLEIDSSARAMGGIVPDLALFNAVGGSSSLQVRSGGTLTVNGFANIISDANVFNNARGNSFASSGRGGFAGVSASDGNATITFNQGLSASASGIGTSGTCLTVCAQESGNGRGGTVNIQAMAGSTTPGGGSSITVTPAGGFGGVFLTADGTGGSAANGGAGTGTGGTVTVSVADSTLGAGNSIILGERLEAVARGFGGDQNGSNLTAGAGTGGFVRVNPDRGGLLQVAGIVELNVDGFGGSVGEVSGSNGGLGKGGTVRLDSTGGVGTFQSFVRLSSEGVGGSGSFFGGTGTGGTGTGGLAVAGAGNSSTDGRGGSFDFSGGITVRADGLGGNGFNGGQGFGGGLDNGGGAVIVAANGTVTGPSAYISAMGNVRNDGEGLTIGGASTGDGGAGGTGTGGDVELQARTNVNGPSTVQFGDVFMESSGQGGNGGTAITPGGTGGRGGDAFGGTVFALAQAGNGTLVVNNTITVKVDAFGGRGGDGGSNDAGTGGLGGAGGNATGGGGDAVVSGGVNFGSSSGANTAQTLGSATFGTATLTGDAFGGRGGDGGSGTTGNGFGGNGGGAIDGDVFVIARGTPVTFTGPLLVSSNATGGDGGNGEVSGNGGSALAGGLGGSGMFVTNRNLQPTVGATLVAGSVTLRANAVGGAGDTIGASTVGDRPLRFVVTNSSASVASLTLNSLVDTINPVAGPSDIVLTNSAVIVQGAFTANLTDAFSLDLLNSSLTASNVSISAGDLGLPVVQTGSNGTITALNNISLSSGGDIGIDASFVAGGSFFATALGNIDLAVTAGSIAAGNEAVIVGDAGVSLGNVVSGLNQPNVSGGQFAIRIGSGGQVQTGDLIAPDYVAVVAGGNVNTGAVGGTDVLLLGHNGVSTDAITATGSLVIADPQTAASAGFIGGSFNPAAVTGAVPVASAGLVQVFGPTTANSVRVAANGGISFFDSLASNSTISLTAGIPAVGGDIIVQDVTAPLAVNLSARGNITANGPISGSTVDLGADFGITVGAVSGNGGVTLESGGAITSADLTSLSGPVLVLNSGGKADISLGTISAGTNVQVLFANAISTGAITAGTGGSSSGTFNIGLSADGAIATGNLSATGYVGVVSGGATTTGDVQASDLVLLSHLGGQTGAINVTGGALFADNSMASTAGSPGGGSFVPGDFFGSQIFQAAGDFKVDGALATSGSILAGTSGSFEVTGNAESSAGTVFISAGGSTTFGGSLTANSGLISLSGGSLSVTGPLIGQTVSTNHSGQAMFGSVSGLSFVSLNATNLTYGTVNSSSSSVTVGGIGPSTISGGAISAFGQVSVFGGQVSVSNLNGQLVTASADQSLEIGSITSGDLFVSLSSGGLLTVTGPITASGPLDAFAVGKLTLGDVTLSTGNNPNQFYDVLLSGDGGVQTGAISTPGNIIVTSPLDIHTGALSGTDILLLGDTDVQIDSATAANKLLVGGADLFNIGSTDGGPYDSASVLAAAPIAAGGDVSFLGAVSATNGVSAYTTATFNANAPITSNAGSVLIRADSSLDLQSSPVTAGGAISLESNGSILADTVTASQNLSIFGGGSGSVAANSISGDFVQVSGGQIDLGSVNATLGFIDISGTGPVNVGSLDAKLDIDVIAGASLTVGTANTSNGFIFLASDGANLALDTASSGGLIELQAQGNIAVTGPLTGSDVLIGAGGDITTGAINIGGNNVEYLPDFRILIEGGGTITTGALTATNDVIVRTPGALTTGVVNASRAVALLGTGGVTSAGINTTRGRLGNVVVGGGTDPLPLLADGTLDLGQVTASLRQSQGAIVFTGAVNAGTFRADTSQTITGTTIGSASVIALSGLAGLQIGSLNAPIGINAFSQQAINLGTVSGAGFVDLFATAGSANATAAAVPASITVGTISTSNAASLRADGAVTVGTVRVNRFLDVLAGGNITANGPITAGLDVSLETAGGAVLTGAITSGASPVFATVPPPVLGPGDSTNIFIRAAGPVTTGNLVSRTDIGIASGAAIQTGTLTGVDIGVLATTDATTGAINATGRVLFANASMVALGTLPNGDIDKEPIFAATPVRAGGSVTINGGTGTAISGTDFKVAAQGPVTITGAVTGSGSALIDAGGNVTQSGGTIGLSAGSLAVNSGGNIQLADTSAGQRITLAATGDVTTGTLSAGTGLSVSGGNLNLGATQAPTGDVALTSTSALTVGNLSTTGALTQGAGTALTAGNLAAGTALSLTGGSVQTGSLSGTTGTTVRATNGSITINGGTGNAVGGGTFDAKATGQIALTGNLFGTGSAILDGGTGVSITGGAVGLPTGSLTLTSGGPVQLGVVTVGGPSAAGAISIVSTGTVTTGQLGATNGITVNGGSAVTTGTAFTNAGPVSLTSAGTLNAGATSSGSGAVSLSAQGALVAAGLGAGTTVTVNGNGTVQLAGVTAGTGATLTAGAALSAGNVTAGSAVAINAASIAVGSVRAGSTLSLSAPGFIQAGVLGGDTLNAVGNITVSGGDVTIPSGNQVFSSQGSVTINATGALTTGVVSGQTGVALVAGGNLVSEGHTANAGAVSLRAGGSVQTAQINARGIDITAGTTFGSGNLFSATGVTITTGGNLATAFVTAAGGSATLVSGGTFNSGVITTTTGIGLTAAGNATVQGLTSSGAISFGSGGSFTNTGTTVSASQVTGQSTGNLSLGAVTVSGGVGKVELASTTGSLTATRITATTDVAAIAGTTLSVPQISGRDIALLAGGNVSLGSINAGATIVNNAATGATGRIGIASNALFGPTQQLGRIDYNALFAATPVALPGSVTITGPVNTGQLLSTSQGPFSGQVVNAFGFIDLVTAGTVTVGQRWTSPDITIQSSDIVISPVTTTATGGTTTAGLNAGVAGEIALISNNANGAFVGDGLTTGNGYALSQAEWTLINSGSLTIGAFDIAGLPIDLTVGNLAITGPLAGSTIDDPNGVVRFVTGLPDAAGNADTPVVRGGIKVNGTIAARGFMSTNALQFDTGTFELDVATGSIGVVGTGTTAGGLIAISADQIHIAEASILDKLRADTLYAGRQADLNTAPATPPAAPVLSSAKIAFTAGRSLFLQNTGTAVVPAGFLANLGGLAINPEPLTSSGTVSIQVNGQFRGDTGNVTGPTAFNEFVTGDLLTAISADSQFNGCSLASSACAPAATAMTPTPDISTQITVLQTSGLPEPSFGSAATAEAAVAGTDETGATTTTESTDSAESSEGSSEEQAEEKAQAAAKAPIAPPAPLVDTRPLNPPVVVTEPVSGGGNPALIGTGQPVDGGNQ